MFNPDQPRDAQGEWTSTGAGEHFPKGPAAHTQVQLFPELRRPALIVHQSNELQNQMDRAEHTARMYSNGTVTATRTARELDATISATEGTPVDPAVEGQKKSVLTRLHQLRNASGMPAPFPPRDPSRLMHPGHKH